MNGLTPCTEATLISFRQEFYDCLYGWADSLFELTDAVLCSATPVRSLPALSLEPEFRRSHGSLYKALAKGSIDSEALRHILLAYRPAHWPAVSPPTLASPRSGVSLPASTRPASLTSGTQRHETGSR